jgi:hypothetical protein
VSYQVRGPGNYNLDMVREEFNCEVTEVEVTLPLECSYVVVGPAKRDVASAASRIRELAAMAPMDPDVGGGDGDGENGRRLWALGRQGDADVARVSDYLMRKSSVPVEKGKRKHNWYWYCFEVFMAGVLLRLLWILKTKTQLLASGAGEGPVYHGTQWVWFVAVAFVVYDVGNSIFICIQACGR